MNSEIVERLKKISITGRMALGIRCLETNLQDLGLLDYPEVQRMLSDFWEYTSSNNLVEWEEKILEYEPWFLFANVERTGFKGFKHLSNDEAKKIYDVIKRFERRLSEIITEVIEIGISNLYSGVRKYSECSLRATMNVMEMLEAMKIPLPNLEIFEKSKFSEHHGWGIRRDRSFFSGID
ncbi:MAG: hypothetical protein AAF806_16930 [Bacteroidota bacterium]